MDENLTKITAIIRSMELSPSEVGTVLWLSEQGDKRVDDLCRIMAELKNYKEETFKKFAAIHKDKYEALTYYFDTLDEANDFASRTWVTVKNIPDNHIYVGISTDVFMDDSGNYCSGSLNLIFPIGAFDSAEDGLYRTTVNYQIFEAI